RADGAGARVRAQPAGDLEQTGLRAELARLHWAQPDEALHLPHAPGRVSLKVVAEVAVHLRDARGERGERHRPRRELAIAVHLHPREVLDPGTPARANPPYVREVGRGTDREVDHPLAREPAPLDERQRDAV